jgi:hypothetical protein
VTQTKGLSYEIIVVDNASFDGCREQLARERPDVVFVQSGANTGFAAANNVGAQLARGPVLLFLNPDTEVIGGALDRLYCHHERMSDAGVLGCRLLNTDGSLQTSCVQALPTVWNQTLNADFLRRCFPRAQLWGMRALFGSATSPVEVQAVSGACMMIGRSVFEGVGGFSPAFFMYGEDLDLCDRLRRAGFRNRYAGDCEIVHHGGGSSQHTRRTFSVVMMRESMAILLRRSHGPVASATYRVASVVTACIRVAILTAVCPAWLIFRDRPSWTGACRKWLAVLAWGLGLDRRARRLPHRTSVLSARV